MGNPSSFDAAALDALGGWLGLHAGRARQREAEGAAAAEVSLRQVVDALPQCLFWKDADGRFLGCNAAAARTVGLQRPDHIVGKTDADLHQDPQVAEYLRVADAAAMRHGVPIHHQLSRLDGPDGAARWLETSKVPLRDGEGVIIGLLIAYDDVSGPLAAAADARAAEARQRAAVATLERRIQAAHEEAAGRERLLLLQSRHAGMGEMIGYTAHQWRQPLTALGLLLQNVGYDLAEGAIDAPTLARKMEQAIGLVKVMSSTIDDFRNFFQPVAEAIRFDAGTSIRDVLRLMDASLDNAGIRVEVELAGPCPVRGRPNELAQVLLNLLGNAKESLAAQSTQSTQSTQSDSSIHGRRIWLRAGLADGMVVIRERNNGGRIPAADMARIFDPYYTTKEDGTGLGLYMCRHIVEQHFAGRIEAVNVDDGVDFSVYLPHAADE